MFTVSRVSRLPPCDFCGEQARYDAKTIFGPWAYMCEHCWIRERKYPTLGTGEGQRLELST